ncbi:hypothetical protein PVL29_024978 [Vitis rotundifolia]|uniref:Terpene synthase metal-binding domain-containing protein n=1 Tax=Vitis rotundifolia TaxID=103349 RepID=A0AA38YTG7_VITRO|nr:hypothetical protein PVL29_024978 [Vitis rotundifolia]
MEEYMSIALVSLVYSMLTTSSFIGMREIVTKEAFDWVMSDPKIVTTSTHVASSVECNMKRYGASEEEVYDKFQKQVVDVWKDINESSYDLRLF